MAGAATGRTGARRSPHWPVAAVVDDIGAIEVILVGHSMGADVALEAARVLPDRVRGIVWICLLYTTDAADD